MWCVHPSHSPACPRGMDLVLCSALRWVELGTSMAVSIGLGDRVHEILRRGQKGQSLLVLWPAAAQRTGSSQGLAWQFHVMRGVGNGLRAGGHPSSDLSCDSTPEGAEVCNLGLSCTVGPRQIFPPINISKGSPLN